MTTMVDILSEMEKSPRPRREPRTYGYWEIECPCGKQMRVRERENTCPSCNRLLVIEWNGK